MAGRKKGTVRKKARKAPPQRGGGEPLSAGEWFEKLVELQRRLRAPNGCPWDREQTHRSLRTYLIEEAYEVLDALEEGDDAKFAEELGDLLLQVVFHAEIAAEEERFTVADVIREIHEKMVRRHPHVFGSKRAKDAAEVLKNWEQIKAQERREKKGADGGAKEGKAAASLLDGVAQHLPATLEGVHLTKRAARIGFDWDNAAGILDKMKEEIGELQETLETAETDRTEEELGDFLFAAVNLARFLKVDPEIALKKANAKFARRFRSMEKLAAGRGAALADVPRAEMEELWESAKLAERKQGALPKAQAKR